MHRYPFKRWFLVVLVASVLFTSARLQAQEAATGFPVDRFILKYARDHVAQPALAELHTVKVSLALKPGGYAADPSAKSTALNLNGPFAASAFSESALIEIFTGVVAALNQRGVYGVRVTLDSAEIDAETKTDRRAPGQRDLTLLIWTSEIGQVRTVAKSSAFGAQEAVLNQKYARILQGSPLRGPTAADGQGALLQKAALEEYLRRLNRHPGRTVEAAISSSDEPGRVVLDYLISEQKPWFAYAQVSNTGTKSTDEFRERVGIVHNQLLNRDDIASVDYITARFSKANAVFGSYSLPILPPDRLRLRGYGSWGDFNATTPEATIVVGGAWNTISGERFAGESWQGGAEATVSLWSWRRFAFDATIGAAYHEVTVKNKSAGLNGEATLLTPYVSVKAERLSEVFTFTGSVGYETNLEFTPTSELLRLGRIDASSSYDLLRGDLTASVYLEPILFGLLPADRRRSTLAHEIALSLRGQYTLGNRRLIPQKEQAIGGFYSVRGYPESLVAGDNVFLASAEYRFHVPRALLPRSVKSSPEGVREESPGTLFGRPFNYRPPHAYARPDWDLIVRGFVDLGFTEINRGRSRLRRPEDRNQTLLGAGLGLELQLLRNLNLRADVGWAIRRVWTNINVTPYEKLPTDVEAGSVRGHFAATFVW